MINLGKSWYFKSSFLIYNVYQILLQRLPELIQMQSQNLERLGGILGSSPLVSQEQLFFIVPDTELYLTFHL